MYTNNDLFDVYLFAYEYVTFVLVVEGKTRLPEAFAYWPKVDTWSKREIDALRVRERTAIYSKLERDNYAYFRWLEKVPFFRSSRATPIPDIRECEVAVAKHGLRAILIPKEFYFDEEAVTMHKMDDGSFVVRPSNRLHNALKPLRPSDWDALREEETRVSRERYQEYLRNYKKRP